MIASNDPIELSIVIVNWNSVDYLKSCLDSLATVRASYEVIVVDNASTGNDVEILGRDHAGIQLIPSSHNLGFARANNLGAINARGEYLLFLNPDTQIIGSAIDVLLLQIRTLPGAGVIGCKLLNGDGTIQLSSIQKFPTILGQMLDAEWLLTRWPGCPVWGLTPLFAESIQPVAVDAISGACMLLKRDVFRQVNGFSEDYFMYAEDMDLNYKVVRAGFRNYYVGAAKIVHYGGKSSSQQVVRHWSTIMQCNAMLQYFNKFRGHLYGYLYRAAMGLVALGRVALLIAGYPIAVLIRKTSAFQRALRKWCVVLSWSLNKDIPTA